jgi:hypothetical protein
MWINEQRALISLWIISLLGRRFFRVIQEFWIHSLRKRIEQPRKPQLEQQSRCSGCNFVSISGRVREARIRGGEGASAKSRVGVWVLLDELDHLAVAFGRLLVFTASRAAACPSPLLQGCSFWCYGTRIHLTNGVTCNL